MNDNAQFHVQEFLIGTFGERGMLAQPADFILRRAVFDLDFQ